MTDLLPRAGLGPLLERHGIGLLAVFGSRARGRARPDSDLDVAVQRRDGRAMSLLELGLLRDELAALTTCPVDILDLVAADTLVRMEVARDGRVLHQCDDEAWKEFVARTLIDHDDIAHALPALIAGVGRAARARGNKP